jgi:predicted nucleic acid-binding protein
MSNVMLDTNAFNRVLDSAIDPALPARGHHIYVTHVQQNELQATRNPDRLERLLAIFSAVPQDIVPTAAAVWDISEFDGAEFGDAGGTYPAMITRLNELNGGKKNNPQDILIAVTALKRKYTLVTDDGDLGVVMREFGGNTMTFVEFIADAR